MIGFRLTGSMVGRVACALALATGGCSDDGLTPQSPDTDAAAASTGGEGATSSVNTTATVSASDGSNDGLRYDVPPPGDTGASATWGADDSTAGSTGSEDDSGTTGGEPPRPDCVATGDCNCDPWPVVCDSVPPRCPPDEVPLVDETMSCWEGSCVPVSSCYTVSDCAWCDEDEVCVSAIDLGGAHLTCQALDPACAGMEPNCECMPTACQAPFFECVPTEPGSEQDLTCVCPTC